MARYVTRVDRLRRHTRVEHLDDEREIGNGVIVTLKEGWTFERGIDNRVRGFDTLSEAEAMIMLDAHRHDGPFTA